MRRLSQEWKGWVRKATWPPWVGVSRWRWGWVLARVVGKEGGARRGSSRALRRRVGMVRFGRRGRALERV
jgi:hypothetical protein